MKQIHQIIIFGILIRITAVIGWGDFTKNNYWEYGEIAKNIIHGNGYSLFYMENSKLQHHFKEDVEPAISAYMPPGYVYFLLPFLQINDIAVRNVLIYLFHILFASIVIYLVYILTKKIFNERTALIAAIISALLPEFIYAILSFSPTVIYHLLVLSILIIFLNFEKIKFRYLYIAFLIASTIYFRSEFVLFFLMIVLFFLFMKQYKISAKLFFIILIMILPWSIRNYLVFEKVVPLTTSFGLNLYRGNNAEGIGSWGDDETEAKISSLGIDNFELEVNKIYQDKAISFIQKNPDEVLKNTFVKLFYFWVYYPNDPRAAYPVYLIPSIFLLLFFIYGIAASFDWKEHLFLYMFFIFSTMVVVIFFPMARYQTMMKVAMIPFCAYGINKVLDYFMSNSKKRN
jgi:4-amino-4-deoxy-L-arabinose transferase-like glycosyltransferase